MENIRINNNIITDNKTLKKFCSYIKNNVDVIAIDTEFIRKFTYFPQLCLVQVGYYNSKGEIETLIIDPLAKKINLNYFFGVLKNKSIKKIIHCCGQDIDAFAFLKHMKIKNVEDTQLMAEFCDEYNIGYTAAVNKFLGLDIKKSKKTQVSNWKKRPLKDSQIKYAKNDVYYLIELYNKLKNILEKNGNYDIYKNELSFVLKNKSIDYIVKNSWKKLRFYLHKMNFFQLNLVKEIAVWREKKAVENNIIRHSIFGDDLIAKLVDIKLETRNDFKELFKSNSQLLSMPKQYKHEFVELILNYYKNSLNSKESNINKIFYMNEKSFPYKQLLRNMTENVVSICKEHNINPAISLTQPEIISLIMKYENKKNILYGWKNDLFGESIANTLKLKNNIH